MRESPPCCPTRACPTSRRSRRNTQRASGITRVRKSSSTRMTPSHVQTTPRSSSPPWGSVIVTPPIHPLVGQEVVVEKLKRERDQLYVVIRHPSGSPRMLPLDWTDRGSHGEHT